MAISAALKQPLKAERVSACDQELHERFLFWLNYKGYSQKRVASMIGRSTAAISQYVGKKFEGNLIEFEKDIVSLLRREEDVDFPLRNPSFCLTSVSQKIWTVLRSCDQDSDMGLIVGPAGCGKTETIREYKRQFRSTVYMTADVTMRSVGSVLLLISRQLPGVARFSSTNSAFLQKIIEHLKNSRRLLVIDEAHFLSWEAFEVLRKIHDCAGTGVVFAGQQRIYDEMRGGRRSFMWDQIYSRVGVRVSIKEIFREDATMIVNNLYPSIDKKSMDFLFSKAVGAGKFRVMTKLLQRAQRVANKEGSPVSVELLREANQLLLL